MYGPLRQQNSQKAMSLPSSPHDFRSDTPERRGTPPVNKEMVSTWNRVLHSPMFQNKPLLPFEEWNIDFSEITVGTRVGIGKHCTSNYFLHQLRLVLPLTKILLTKVRISEIYLKERYTAMLVIHQEGKK